jgi:hypothetical protein
VLLGARVKNLLREKIKGLLPMLEVVGMFIDVPDVRNVVLLEIGVQGPADTNQTILVAARYVEQF